MIDSITTLIDALRDELQQYGEMLALLDRQQQRVIERAADEVFQSIGLVKNQGNAIQNARARREQCRAQVAQLLLQGKEATFAQIIPLLPADYRPLVGALVDENNALLVRVRQRARQNHLLLSRSLELMQGLINTLFPGREPHVYNGHGAMRPRGAVGSPIYEAVG